MSKQSISDSIYSRCSKADMSDLESGIFVQSSYSSKYNSAKQRKHKDQSRASFNESSLKKHVTFNDPKLDHKVKGNVSQRSAKSTQKVVLLPEEEKIESTHFDDDQKINEGYIRFDEDYNFYRMNTFNKSDSPKNFDLPRLTAYCTTENFDLTKTFKFLKDNHNVKPRVYDECIYAPYRLPLLAGDFGSDCRVRSSKEPKNLEGYNTFDSNLDLSEVKNHQVEIIEKSYLADSNIEILDDQNVFNFDRDLQDPFLIQAKQKPSKCLETENQGQNVPPRSALKKQDTQNMYQYAELFVFNYGVIVLWNFNESQEKDILADLTFFEGASLMSKPLSIGDWQVEQLNFEYSPLTATPRIYNDIIILRSNDHFLKLAMSHALAQSVKLSFFEDSLEKNIERVQHIPKRIAVSGNSGMTRDQVMQLSGGLFQLRTAVNLSSNILDTPDFFWESEPALHPLYTATREYLEIEARINVLNERCEVLFDLLNILSDSISESNEDKLTWYIIYLIVLSVFITISEVIIRFFMITSRLERN